MAEQKEYGTFKERIADIIFESDTFYGKLFDIVLLWAILLSVLEVMVESVTHVRLEYGEWLSLAEWFFTVLFTIEYVARIWVAKNSWKYIFSFYGLVDLFSILPTYFGLFFSSSSYLRTIRIFRLLRVFRILKLVRYLSEADNLISALKASRAKIVVFLMGVVVVAVLVGTIMYIIEGPEAGFTSIPRSIYWAIVTVTTVGFGDITPQSVVGQTLASLLMIIGYGIIAVPTGIVSAEFATFTREGGKLTCGECHHEVDRQDHYCRNCGKELRKKEATN